MPCMLYNDLTINNVMNLGQPSIMYYNWTDDQGKNTCL